MILFKKGKSSLVKSKSSLFRYPLETPASTKYKVPGTPIGERLRLLSKI